MYIFHSFSWIALVANLLVVPLVPLAMLLALVAGMGGMIWPAMAGWYAWPAQHLLTYLLDVAHVLSRIPRALQQYSMSLLQMLAAYALTFGISLLLWRRTVHVGVSTKKES